MVGRGALVPAVSSGRLYARLIRMIRPPPSPASNNTGACRGTRRAVITSQYLLLHTRLIALLLRIEAAPDITRLAGGRQLIRFPGLPVGFLTTHNLVDHLPPSPPAILHKDHSPPTTSPSRLSSSLTQDGNGRLAEGCSISSPSSIWRRQVTRSRISQAVSRQWKCFPNKFSKMFAWEIHH